YRCKNLLSKDFHLPIRIALQNTGASPISRTKGFYLLRHFLQYQGACCYLIKFFKTKNISYLFLCIFFTFLFFFLLLSFYFFYIFYFFFFFFFFLCIFCFFFSSLSYYFLYVLLFFRNIFIFGTDRLSSSDHIFSQLFFEISISNFAGVIQLVKMGYRIF